MDVRSTRRRGRFALAGALVVAGSLLLAACGGGSSSSSSSDNTAAGGSGSCSDTSPIKVGMAVGLTGAYAPGDVPYSHGVQLAVDELNAKGGIDGRKVELIILDTQSAASNAVTVANQLINQNGVVAMINGVASAQTAAVAPVAARAQVPVLAPSLLPEDPEWVFSTLAPQDKGAVAAEVGFTTTVVKPKKAAVMYNSTPFGQAFAESTVKQLEAAGITVTESIGIDLTATDLSSQLVKVRDSGAEVIVGFLGGPNQIVLAKNASSLGLTIPIILSTDTMKTYQTAAGLYPKTYFILAPVERYDSLKDAQMRQAAGDFIAKFTKAYPADADQQVGQAAQGFDEFQMLVKALGPCGKNTGEALRAALETTSLVGVSGKYQYSKDDHTGLKQGSVVPGIGHLQDGKIVIDWSEL